MSRNKYETRQEAAAAYVIEADLDAIILEDTEGRRCSSIRYLTGLPQDGLLFVFRSGRTVLLPWDILMADRMATASAVIPLTDFNRSIEQAIPGVLTREGFGPGSRIEMSARTPYPLFLKIRDACKEILVSCPGKGVEHRIEEGRARKDEEETGYIREATSITNEVLDLLAAQAERGELSTELETAMFIEKAGRMRGAEGMGFETIAAGPARSFGIHAFPSYTNAPIGTEGLSIIDFGFRCHGYTSDVTVTIARGRLSDKQRTMVDLVRETHDRAVEAAVPGARIWDICALVDDTFAAAGFTMPHSLGHGVGLDAHEAPLVSTRAAEDAVLSPGMVITIEPGLYAADAGGVRLENDLLITPSGNDLLTRSRILLIP